MDLYKSPEPLTDKAHQILNFFEEEQLLAEVANGSVEAFTRLFNIYLPLMHRYIEKFLDFHRPDIEEVSQDTFLKIWKKKEILVTVRSFEKYLYVVGRHTLIDFYRRRKSDRSKRLADQYHNIPDYPADEKVIHDEYIELANRAIDLLPEKRKLIFRLRTQEELTIEEIAERTDSSVGGVHLNLKKAVTFIRDHLKDKGLGVGSAILYLIFCQH